MIERMLSNFAAACSSDGNFFGFPTWYKYLKVEESTYNGMQTCTPILNSLSDVWKIGLAGVEIMLRVAILVAIVFVLVSGIKYVNSRGNPEKTATAKNTLFDALVGLVIAIIATAVVAFVGSRFSQ